MRMTTPDYQAQTLSPMVPMADVQRSIGFYTEVLGFEVAWQSETYSILHKGGASLHLQLASDPAVFEAARNHLSVYLTVAGIESLWAHVAQFKDRYKIRDLFDRDYGMHEFHIIDPSGCLIFVGEPVRAGKPSNVEI